MYCLKKCVDYFVENGSRVFVSFMDCSKAFDRVNHGVLFNKLIARGLPLCFVQIIVYWYSNLSSKCRWGDIMGDSFLVPSGVRQGGILSPYLFSIYINEFIENLRKLGIGCYLIDLFLACLFYADDLVLLSPLRGAMQILIDVTVAHGDSIGLLFNPSKTKVMIIGKLRTNFEPLPLIFNGQNVEFVKEWRYLGFYLTAGDTLGYSATNSLISFYRTSNCLINSVYKPSEEVLMKLLYSYCVPRLTYGAQVTSFNYRDTHAMSVALNNAIRKIFGWNRWQSVTDLRKMMGYNSIEVLFAKMKRNFLSNLAHVDNAVFYKIVKYLS